MRDNTVGADRRDAFMRRKRLHATVARAGKKHAKWEAAQTGRFLLRVTPGSVAVTARSWAKSRPVLGNSRGIVRGWSDRSKRRFRLRVASIPWPAVRYVFLTLTYPDAFPRDPEIWKQHLHEFEVAWRKRYGSVRAVWVLEFQRRGAPHFHMVLVAPDQKLPQLRRWYAATWHRIVTSCSGDHDRAVGLADTCVPWHYERHMADEHCKDATGARAAVSYLTRELGKESQKSLPAYLDDQDDGTPGRGAGRWWGVWGFAPDEQEISVTKREYVQLRHAMLRLGREVARRQAEHHERIRQWKLRTGKPWTPRRKPGGRWLSPRSLHQGLVVMDPDLRPYVFARAFSALLREIRRPAEVRLRGSRDPIVSVLDELDRRAARQPMFGWA